MKKWVFLLVSFAVLLLTASLLFINQQSILRPKIEKEANKISVAASFYPLFFFASQIGGSNIQVTNLTPPGIEPHEYEPTTQDIIKIEQSKLLILNGRIETWMDKLQNILQGKSTYIVVAGEGLFTQEDPHIWLSPKLAKLQAKKITEGLITIDKDNTKFYEKNLEQLNRKLDQLDQQYSQGLLNCPKKEIITSHSAFGYLASAYALKQIPITGLSPDQEPSIQQLAEIARFAKENNTKYIFFEELANPKLSETIAKEVNAKILMLNPLETLSNQDISKGKNYFTVMQDNLKNLQTALECNKT